MENSHLRFLSSVPIGRLRDSTEAQSAAIAVGIFHRGLTLKKVVLKKCGSSRSKRKVRRHRANDPNADCASDQFTRVTAPLSLSGNYFGHASKRQHWSINAVVGTGGVAVGLRPTACIGRGSYKLWSQRRGGSSCHWRCKYQGRFSNAYQSNLLYSPIPTSTSSSIFFSSLKKFHIQHNGITSRAHCPERRHLDTTDWYICLSPNCLTHS